jgi:hypothetical protein
MTRGEIDDSTLRYPMRLKEMSLPFKGNVSVKSLLNINPEEITSYGGDYR